MADITITVKCRKTFWYYVACMLLKTLQFIRNKKIAMIDVAGKKESIFTIGELFKKTEESMAEPTINVLCE